VDIEELNDDPDWERVVEENKPECSAKSSDGTEPKMIYYYNKKTREIRWKMTNVKVSSGGKISFQLVVKITDPDVLLGVKTGSYTNQVKVYQDDKLIDKATCGPTTIKKKTMSKTIGDAGQTGNKMPFKIVINQAGEDLISGSNVITVVDELGSSLILDLTSIEITDKDGNVLSKDDYTVAEEKEDGKTILKLTVPDDKKLTITYTTTFNAFADEEVQISNVAHWEGYAAESDTEIKENRSFNLTGMAVLDGEAKLKLTKRDEENVFHTLSGATFTMQKATRNDDGSFTLTGDVHTATTNDDGVLTFSADANDHWMEYDTIYCVTETNAPEGYELDSTPRYILLASWGNTTTYSDDIEVQRYSVEYDMEAFDVCIKYELPYSGGCGTDTIRMLGVFFLAVATVGFVARRKTKIG
jgi:hypothetical protein